MQRTKSMIVAVVLIFVICSVALTQEKAATNVIYLIDISGSMSEGGLFNKIKDRLKELMNERKTGDRVILGTFSETVEWPVQVDIKRPEDISDINEIIDKLTARGPWTWMSKAFKETKEKAEEIKSKVPNEKIIIYILTDCINDPPPHIKEIEPPWKFVEVLLEYFEGFKVEGSYVYLLSYRDLDPQEKQTIRDSTAIIPIEPEKREFPRIVLSISEFNFGEIDLTQGNVQRSGEIRIEKLQDVERGEIIQLIPPLNFKVEPESIVCKQEGQKESICITIPSGIHSGEHVQSVRLYCEKAPVEPSDFKFAFSVPEAVPEKETPQTLFGIIMLLLALTLLYVLYDSIIKTMTVWVEKKGEGRIEEINIKGWKKVYMGEKLANQYIPLGLPKLYVMRERLKNSLLIIDEDGEKQKVIFNDQMNFRDIDGNETALCFYKNQPNGESNVEIEQKADRLSPWDRIEGKDK